MVNSESISSKNLTVDCEIIRGENIRIILKVKYTPMYMCSTLIFLNGWNIKRCTFKDLDFFDQASFIWDPIVKRSIIYFPYLGLKVIEKIFEFTIAVEDFIDPFDPIDYPPIPSNPCR